jgi:hypothetical protein
MTLPYTWPTAEFQKSEACHGTEQSGLSTRLALGIGGSPLTFSRRTIALGDADPFGNLGKKRLHLIAAIAKVLLLSSFAMPRRPIQ